MGRTMPSWRVVVDQKIAELSRFKQFLRPQDRVVFDDLLTQCKLHAGETLGPSVTAAANTRGDRHESRLAPIEALRPL